MLNIQIVESFVDTLWSVENTTPESKLHLLKLYRNAVIARKKLEDSVQSILLPLPLEGKVDFLRNCLEQLSRDSSIFSRNEWWIEECIREKPNTYWFGELGEVGNFMGYTREAISETAYNIALGIAARRENSNEYLDIWKNARKLARGMSSFAYEDIDLIIKQYIENGDEFPYDNIPFEENESHGIENSIISSDIFRSAIYSLSSHLAFIENPKAGFTASPSFKWQSIIETNITDLISGLYEDEQEGNELAKDWRSMLSVARDKMYEKFYWGKDAVIQKADLPNISPTLAWQGSKTELAELGYALLEAGLIGGPREAALKALADFFGQDMGNPAKHLQTLQKRKWDSSGQEPVTPLIDRLRASLKSFLRIKEVAPVKK